MFYVPEDENLPVELHDASIEVELSDWQPAEPDVGINTGYYETIILTPTDTSLIAVLEDYEDYIIDKYEDDIQNDDGSVFEDEPPEVDPNPTPNDSWGA